MYRNSCINNIVYTRLLIYDRVYTINNVSEEEEIK